MTDITMPQLSDAMEEGTIVKWLVDDGGEVAVGDELVEIETDKATMAYAAEAADTLQIVVPEGEPVPVGAAIARSEPRPRFRPRMLRRLERQAPPTTSRPS